MSHEAGPVRYVAVVRGSRELGLVGHVDPDWWRRRLAPEGLVPFAPHGPLEVTVAAVASRWVGVSFGEAMIGLPVAARDGTAAPDGLFLPAGFNSSRVFAWFERHWFRTPYEHAAVAVDGASPTGFAVVQQGRAVLEARRAAGARSDPQSPAEAPRDDCWEGAILLPQRPRGASFRREKFFARLAGPVREVPFAPQAGDSFATAEADAHPVARALHESQFAPHAWRIRDVAEHARSKTVPR